MVKGEDLQPRGRGLGWNKRKRNNGSQMGQPKKCVFMLSQIGIFINARTNPPKIV